MALTKVTNSMIVDAPFDPLDYGASTSESGANNTAAFQAAIDAANAAGGGVVLVKYGSYTIAGTTTNPSSGSALVALEMKSNVHLMFEDGAELVMQANSADSYAMILVPYDAVNVTISGKGILTGDWVTHTGVTGEGGMGIWLAGCTGTKISDLTIQTCWGDGIFYTRSFVVGAQSYVKDVIVENVNCVRNRRQGYSIISCDGLTMNNCSASLTGFKPGGGEGTDPSAGIDIEPDVSSHKMRRCVINNFTSYGNLGAGIRVDFDEVILSDNVYEITINNHVDDSSNFGFAMTGSIAAPGGYVVINNAKYSNNQSSGVSLTKCQTDGVRVFLDRVTVVNPGRDVNTRVNGTAFSFVSDASQTAAAGNVCIVNPSVSYSSSIASTSRMYYAYEFNAASSYGFDSTFKLIDPLYAVGDSATVGGGSSQYNQKGAGTQSQYVSDYYRVMEGKYVKGVWPGCVLATYSGTYTISAAYGATPTNAANSVVVNNNVYQSGDKIVMRAVGGKADGDGRFGFAYKVGSDFSSTTDGTFVWSSGVVSATGEPVVATAVLTTSSLNTVYVRPAFVSSGTLNVLSDANQRLTVTVDVVKS